MASTTSISYRWRDDDIELMERLAAKLGETQAWVTKIDVVREGLRALARERGVTLPAGDDA